MQDEVYGMCKTLFPKKLKQAVTMRCACVERAGAMSLKDCGIKCTESLSLARAPSLHTLQVAPSSHQKKPKHQSRLGRRREMTFSAETFRRLVHNWASMFLFLTINFFFPSFPCNGTTPAACLHTLPFWKIRRKKHALRRTKLQ